MAEQPSKIKVSVNLLEEELETLRSIAQKRGITVTEVLRRAIAMEKFVDEQTEDGAKLLVEDKNKNIKQVVIR